MHVHNITIELQVGAHTLKVHRAVLSIHSNVFRQMFAIDMKEAREQHVKITDFCYEPVRALVEFMYMPDAVLEKTKGADNCTDLSINEPSWLRDIRNFKT
jgi:hypothetical protein